MQNLSHVVSTVLAGLIVLWAGTVSGQAYPSKAIRISTVPPGGGTDGLARIIATGITGPMGQPVIVDNRPTNLAIENVRQASPDGYNILVVGASLWIRTVTQIKPEWDPVNDFAPITTAVNMTLSIVVHPSMPVKSIKELIALAKARPGELNYSQDTPGGGSHLAGELFKSIAGVNLVGIPYRSSTGGMTALLGGETQVGFENLPSAGPHVKSGKLRLLAITAEKPSALAPGVPTVNASGLAGYSFESYQGVWAPAKTPAPIIRRLNQEIVRVLHMPDVRQKILETGVEPNGNSPEEFAALIKSDLAKLSKVVREAGIKPQ